MEDLLHCPKCLQRFDDGNNKPKLLQCHHTYCLKCLQGLQTRQGHSKKSSKSVTCPTCNKVTSVGKKGISSLQDNFYITTFRSTLEMHASETESAVDDIYVSDEEDQPSPALPPENVDDWCKTCKRVAVPGCVASKHNLCNLLKLIQGLLAQFGDLVLSQLETREPLLHALQSAELALFGVLHGLQEDISSQDMLLSMARSEKQWLLATDLCNKTTDALANRFGKLDLQVSAAADQLERARTASRNFLGLRRATLHLDFGDERHERQRVALDFAGDTDDEKALRYLLYRMMQAKKLSVPDVTPEDPAGSTVEEWKVVGSEKTSHKVDAAVPRGTSATRAEEPLHRQARPPVATFNRPPSQRVSVHSVDKAASAQPRQPRLQGGAVPSREHPAERRELSTSAVGHPRLSAHSHQCFFEIEVNSKSIGTVVMKLRPDLAPKMCSNFVALCTGELGFGYKGSHIFKVYGNSFVVGGDFENNDGSGGYSIFNKGYFLGDDCNLQDSCGALRMRGMGTDLKTGLGKVGSQFHIWVGEKDFKDYKKTLVFGHVVKGLDILQHVSNFKTLRNGEGDYKLKSVVIIKNCGTL